LLMPALEVMHPAKLVAGAALVMLLVETVLARKSFEFAWPEGILLLGFLGSAALSSLTALWVRQAVESLSDLMKMALVYFFIVNCANTERRLRGVMWTMVIGGLFPAAGVLRNYLYGNLVEGRAAWVGIFANPNDLAYSLVILLPLALFLAPGLRPMPRLALMGISAAYIAAIFVTFSRGGAVGLVAVIALYAWRKKNALLQGLIVLLVVAGVIIAGRLWTRSEDFSHLNGDISFRQRWATSQAGLAMFADHPLLGVGLGCSVIAWPLYAPADLYTRTALVTHNTFIQPLAEIGMAGFLPFILFVGFGLYYARNLALESSSNGLANLGAGLEISLWGFVVCGLSGPYTLSWFPYILVGLVSAARRVGGTR
ncbi:MAG TPA: O-antigen ligase family protein, partial [Bryobacteraceae bacterium]|nr:O-antigen ligase family protein [Bryobacteraceae bacterium]